MKKSYHIIEEQIERLKQKGLKFKNEEQAKAIILRENHYAILEGYEDIFIDLKRSTKQNEVYEEDTYFEELYAIYRFDRSLKWLIFDYINLLETMLKAYISYAFSDHYGDSDYLVRENFRSEEKFDQEFEKLRESIQNNLERSFHSQKSDLKLYLKTHPSLPFWMLIKVFTFGNLVNFYSLMKPEDKQEVAQAFCLSPYSLEDYLKLFNIVRNICAHGDLLFNLRSYIRIKPRDCAIHEKLKIPKQNQQYICGISDFFAVLILLKKLLPQKEFSQMFLSIEQYLADLKNELDAFSYQNLLEEMGFPKNYGELDSLFI